MRRAGPFVLAAIILTAVTLAVAAERRQSAPAGGAAPDAFSATITVYKSPTCGCCNKWIEHLREHGFQVIAHDTTEMAQVKDAHGVARALRSCHTAIVDGYVIEGHVPADVIQRLLAERPELAGLAVPGMPMGAPGMEGPRAEPYDVIAFDHEGRTSVYAHR
ncbi:MAG TPA: DUF411 domain-containing protein [Longimicrobiales bacterium]